MREGFLYLVAIIDWATRRVLSWRLSNTLTAEFCVEALNEALAWSGKPASPAFSIPIRARNSPVMSSPRCYNGRDRETFTGTNRRPIDGPRLGARRTKIERGPRLGG
jgi:transposase InsO family protein